MEWSGASSGVEWSREAKRIENSAMDNGVIAKEIRLGFACVNVSDS